ncbi:hypothetical protein ACN27G_02620 [Plantactinospora sp. WMMB334]|uniref:hypothetical protein n=1 Tax=Plantactinospora sp. WMMB334 TaxID=3404119 RepID=UPI003B963B64
MVGDVPGAADLLGEFYDDGTCSVTVPDVNGTGTNIDTSRDEMTTPPQGFGDLIAGLNYRNGESGAGEPDQIDVRVVTHPDGSTAYVVDIPGTKVMNMPWDSDSPFLNDMGTNVHVLGVLFAVAACGGLADSPEERAESDAIATEIQEALAARPDVVRVKVGYQNNISNSASASVTATLKAGADFDPFLDEAVRLVWLSRLDPLSSISAAAIDAEDEQRGTTRHLTLDDSAELERRYGPRPPS